MGIVGVSGAQGPGTTWMGEAEEWRRRWQDGDRDDMHRAAGAAVVSVRARSMGAHERRFLACWWFYVFCVCSCQENCVSVRHLTSHLVCKHTRLIGSVKCSSCCDSVTEKWRQNCEKCSCPGSRMEVEFTWPSRVARRLSDSSPSSRRFWFRPFWWASDLLMSPWASFWICTVTEAVVYLNRFTDGSRLDGVSPVPGDMVELQNQTLNKEYDMR